MAGIAFCPAHITGFFGVRVADSPESTGSVGAGFSIQKGVTTTVHISEGGGRPGPLPRYVLDEFLEATGNGGTPVQITHDIEVPAGYGLGVSGALALSTAYALDAAFGTGLDPQRLAIMAHRAEIHNRTGLGDVLACYHGGFEVRTAAGGPGYGSIQSMPPGDLAVLIVCMSPLSTSLFWKDRMDMLNGMGEQLIWQLLDDPAPEVFQRLSMKFARNSGIMTPVIEDIAGRLEAAGAGCGMAMLGETAFAMVPAGEEGRILQVLDGYPVIRTRIDTAGARVL